MTSTPSPQQHDPSPDPSPDGPGRTPPWESDEAPATELVVEESDTERGTRVLETLVTLSILVSLAGIVLPMLTAPDAAPDPAAPDVALARDALLDMQEIADGLAAYSDDTRYLPTGAHGRTDVAWLYGPGTLPSGEGLGFAGRSRPLDDVLSTDAMGGNRWNGPYAQGLGPDPWGHAYLVNVDGLVDGREHAMVVSAGPDGVIQTAPGASSAAGDDLLVSLD